ncbi:SPOR domain-containing protein, partial [Halorhodospira neutriphila]
EADRRRADPRLQVGRRVAGEARPGGSAETGAGASSAGAGDSGAGEGVSLGEGDYAVQVGSFRKESNARAERDRIRDLGIPAYLEVVEYEGETMHRVRVGPVMGREEAEALLERVTEAADVNGFVVQR